MNKYHDIRNHHSKAQSFSLFPTLRLVTFPKHTSKQENVSSTDSNFEPLTPKSNSVQPIERKIKHKSISEFSEKQNEKIFNFLTPLALESGKRSFFPDIHLRPQGFSDRDYSNLMSSINEVISPRGAVEYILLNEGESYEVLIAEGKIKYFRIPVKKKRTPMIVKIKRAQGRVCCYTSSEVQEPNQFSYDKYFTNDYFEIREPTMVFKYDMIFIGAKAIEEASLKIQVSFGSKIVNLEELKRIKRELTLIPTEITQEDEEDKDYLKTNISQKDFIAENKFNTLVTLTSRASILSERAESWKARRQQVLCKRKINLEDKKNRALETLNKKKLKEEQEAVRRQELKVKKLHVRFWSFWLSYSYFSASLSAIRSTVRRRREEKVRARVLLNKVLLIQSAYKAFSHSQDIRSLLLTRSKNSLVLYYQSTRTLARRHSGRNLTNFVSFAANAFRAFNKFSTYFRNVIRIQRNIRMHLSRKEQLIQELRRMWTSACEHYLFRKSSGKKQHKRHASLKIISIPTHIRDVAIEDYYVKCVERYKKDMRMMRENLKDNDRSKLFHTALSGFLQKSLMFQDYLPTRRQLEKIIEAVVRRVDEEEKEKERGRIGDGE